MGERVSLTFADEEMMLKMDVNDYDDSLNKGDLCQITRVVGGWIYTFKETGYQSRSMCMSSVFVPEPNEEIR